MTVHVIPYTPSWKSDFAQARGQLAAALEDPSVQIEHIGSTAVEGLCAKPVIDVLLGAASLGVFESAVPRLERAGFRYVDKYEAELPMRRYFVRPEADGPRMHVHGVCIGSDLWQAHLAFRDALRADATLRDAYARLKLELANTHRADKAAYTAAKGPFIQHVLATRSEATRRVG